MKIYSVSQQNNIDAKRQKKNNRRDYALGTASSVASAYAFTKLLKPLRTEVGKSFLKVQETTPAERIEIHNGLNKVLKDSGLQDKGVKIFRVNDNAPVQNFEKMRKDAGIRFFDIKGQLELIENVKINVDNKELESILKKDFSARIKSKPLNRLLFRILGKEESKKLIEKVASFAARKSTLMYQNGENASYYHSKLVVLPETKLAGAGYHELGHATAHQFGKVDKLINKCKRIASPKVLAALALIAVLGKQKPKSENKFKNTDNKAHNSIRKHLGLITLGLFAPTLIDEANASRIGNKLAKSVLSPELAQKVRKANKAAYMTYVLGAGSVAAVIQLAASVKDGVIKHRKDARTKQTQTL